MKRLNYLCYERDREMKICGEMRIKCGSRANNKKQKKYSLKCIKILIQTFQTKRKKENIQNRR